MSKGKGRGPAVVAERPPQRRPNKVAQAAIAAGLGCAAYFNSLANGFVADDKQQLVGNPLVSGHRIGAMFGAGVWAFRGARGNYYRPLQFAVYAAMHALFGFSAPPFHALQMLLHAGASALVYAVGARFARPRAALAAALLFALHPIHTEAVDWIAALPDVLVTVLALGGIWMLVRQDAAPRGLQILGHCGLYAAALLTKETGIVLPALYLALETIWLRRRPNAALYGGMAATLGLYLAARWAALGGLAPAQATFHRLTAVEFALSAVAVAGEYARLLIAPVWLNYFHVFRQTSGIDAAFVWGAIAIAAAAWAAWHWRRRAPAASFAIVWMAVTLAPAMNLTGVGQNVVAERYLYLPSVGFAWLVGMAWDWYAARMRGAAWVVGLTVLCVCARQTVTRNSDWRNDYTLLTRTLAQSPDAGVLHNNLAGVYVDRGDFARALVEERAAVRWEPRAAPFHKNLGLLLMLSDRRAARAEFEEAQRLDPADASLVGYIEEARRAGGQ